MACSRLGSGATDCGRQNAETRLRAASINTYLRSVEFFLEAGHALVKWIDPLR